VVTEIEPNAGLPKLRWDGSRVLFEIESDGQAVRCAISRSALQHIGGPRNFAPADLLRSFEKSRERIEAIAAGKFAASPESASGIVSIWADDVEDPHAGAAAVSNL